MDYLVSAIEMAELDRQTITDLDIPSRVLMETAGRAAAEVCRARLPPHSRVVVACGPGNNGGDGYVVARVLAAADHDVKVFVFAERDRLVGDALAALSSLEKAYAPPIVHATDAHTLVAFASEVAEAELVVDALLGIGISGEVRGIFADAITIINERARRVVSIDIPSGIDGSTGVILGGAVRASTTVTFGFAKRGHYLYPGAELCGELVVVDIGIPRRLARALGVPGRVLHGDDLASLLPERRADAHKGSFGKVVVLGGSRELPGAALLATEGAARSGPGLTCWATDAETLASTCRISPDITLMLRSPAEDAQSFAARLLSSASALVIGPGLSTAPSKLADLKAVLAQARVPMVIDADGLNLIARDQTLWRSMQAPVVITPHPKELARLSGREVADIQADRFASAMQFALSSNCVVVLKGAGTVIAEPDGTVAVAATGNVGLAKGGTGDVLAGVIGGLLAQGIDPSKAARAAVLAHGMAADRLATELGKIGMLASDLPRALGQVWRECGR